MTVLIGLLETRLFAIDKLQPEWNSALYVVANQDALGLCDCETYIAVAYPASTTSTEQFKPAYLFPDPYFIDFGGLVALLCDEARGARNAGALNTQKSWTNSGR